MVYVHRFLLDPALDPYCERYLTRLRYLHDSGTRWYNKTEVTSFYIAQLAIAGDHLTVRMFPLGGLSYEFFTSEHIDDATLSSPGHFHTTSNAYVCGSAVRVGFTQQGTVRNASSVYSTSLDPGTPPAWRFFDCEFAQNADDGLITWQSWQNQRFFEHCWHPGNDGTALVTSTQAQPPGWANRMGMYSPYCWTRFGNIQAFVTDVGLDIPVTLYTKGGSTSGAPQLEHSWLYWRRGAVQTAGGRQFFICTDNYGRFFVYPVKDYGSQNLAIPPAQYKVYTPPYPSWVTVPSPSDFFPQFSQWLWRFNKDATKCVSVPFHSVTNTDFKKFLLEGAFLFCAFLPEDSTDLDPSIAVVDSHEDTPGLVEFSIGIDVTGPGDMDFVATFELRRSTYFGTDGRFIFDAAYFMKDVENIGVAEDTLITAELQCKTPAGYYNAGPFANTWATHGLDAVRQMQATLVINQNDAGMIPTQIAALGTYGPLWYQFPTAQAVRDGIPNTGFDVQTVPTFSGSKNASPMGPSLYDPDSVAVPGRIFWGPLTVATTRLFLYSMELSTLSWSHETDNEATGKFDLYATVYGQQVYHYQGDLGYSLPPFTASTATDAVPSARVHQGIFNAIINIAQGDGFSVHPLGHWAHVVGGFRNGDLPIESDLDIISIVAGKNPDGTLKRVTLKHKDMFNRAFQQTRDYSFYHTPFTGENIGDFGSFRTAGIFVTFR